MTLMTSRIVATQRRKRIRMAIEQRKARTALVIAITTDPDGGLLIHRAIEAQA